MPRQSASTIADSHPAERERRVHELEAAPAAQRSDLFRTLTEDVELDAADREMRWETLGDRPLEALDRLLQRARQQ